MQRQAYRLRHGTSLVEAVVALAVMALGMLAVVGIQSTLRLNADVAKQRSQAVRIAQEAMERARGFSVIEAPGVGETAYADIATAASAPATGYTYANTAFTITRTVSPPDTDPPPTCADTQCKQVTILVEWIDRNGEPQFVELNSIVGANDPRVALLLGARPNGIPLRQPLGRNVTIPPQAKAMGGGVSAFKPPSPDGQVVWVFNNLTGMIVGVCNTVTTGQAALTGADIAACSNNATGRLLSGFVRFASDLVQTTAAVAENPTSTALNLSLALTLTSVGHPAPNHVCYADAPPSAALASLLVEVPYFCAVFPNTGDLWSGRSDILPLGFSDAGNVPWVLADNAADASASRYRVCRYTPAVNDAEAIANRFHPRNYVDVNTALLNQNFLVVRAGDDTTAFTCPIDVPIDVLTGDLVNSNTLVHQPQPAPA